MCQVNRFLKQGFGIRNDCQHLKMADNMLLTVDCSD